MKHLGYLQVGGNQGKQGFQVKTFLDPEHRALNQKQFKYDTLTWSQENNKLWKYKIICPMGECFSVLLVERICILGSGRIQDNTAQDKKYISSGCCCCAEGIKTAKLMLEEGSGCTELCCLQTGLWPLSGQNFLAGLCLVDGSWAAGNTEFPDEFTYGGREGKSGFLTGYWYCGSCLPGVLSQEHQSICNAVSDVHCFSGELSSSK